MTRFLTVPTVDRSPPPYQQIAEHVREQMRRGELLVGQSLPPVHQLVKDWTVSEHTVQRALHKLRDEGLIEIRRARRALVISLPAPKPPP
jgi:GntR family transcriptional regulator